MVDKVNGCGDVVLGEMAGIGVAPVAVGGTVGWTVTKDTVFDSVLTQNVLNSCTKVVLCRTSRRKIISTISDF